MIAAIVWLHCLQVMTKALGRQKLLRHKQKNRKITFASQILGPRPPFPENEQLRAAISRATAACFSPRAKGLEQESFRLLTKRDTSTHGFVKQLRPIVLPPRHAALTGGDSCFAQVSVLFARQRQRRGVTIVSLFILCSRRNTNIHARMTLRLPKTSLTQHPLWKRFAAV